MLFLLPLKANAGSGALATHRFTTGWATFGQPLPMGQAWEGLQVGDLPTQTDVKNRYDDGSIQFAVVSTYVPKDGEYPLTASEQTTEESPIEPDHDIVEVKLWLLDGSEREYVATFYPGRTPYTWVDGPLAFEHVDYSGLYDSEDYNTWHPFLWVGFDCRTYADGQEKMFVWVENTDADDPNSHRVPYHVMIKYGDEVVFYKENVMHYYLSRWRFQFNGTDFEESEVTTDNEPIFAANYLPRHMSSVVRPWNLPDHNPAGSEIMSHWWLQPEMPRSGGRDEIAPVPDPVGRYLTFKDPSRRRLMWRLGDNVAGAFPVHARAGVPIQNNTPQLYDDEFPGSLLNTFTRTDVWHDERGHEPWYQYAHRIKGNIWGCPMIPDSAHVPSLAFLPYAETGDWYFAEEAMFWGAYVMNASMPSSREGRGLIHFNQNRAIGWGLRNMLHAWLVIPDGDPAKEYFEHAIRNNLQKLDEIAAGYQSSIFPNFGIWRNEIYDGRLTVGPAEVQRICYAIQLCNSLGFTGGEYAKQRIIECTLNLFNNPDYPRVWAAPYYLQVGYVDDQFRHIFFNNIVEARLATFGTGWPGDDEDQLSGYYGVDAALVSGMGVVGNYEGAQDTYDYIFERIGLRPHIDGVPDLARRAGWAFDLRGPGSS